MKKRLFATLLCLLMVFSLVPTTAFAAEYPYQYPAEKPYYEMSMYAYKVNAADAESYPTGIFRLLTDDNRTLYAYCADSEIYDIPGTAYKAISLSDHYGAETASTGKLRTIIQNSYPFISMNEMISRIEQSGISLHTASVPCYEMVLISAIQQALYTYTNPDIVIEVQFAGGFPKKGYEMYKPLIYHYNDNYKDKKVTQAYPDIKADVEAVYSWLCALSPSNAPNVPNVNVSFAAEVEQVTSGHVLILYDLFDGFEDYNESLNVYVTEIVGTNENLIFEKPFNEFVPVGEGRYAMALPNTITGSSLKVTLNGYNDYEDVVIYEAKKAEAETSQPFIGYGKARVPFSKTEQIDMPIQTGSLIVRKTVSGEGSDAHKSFPFTVTLMQNGDTPNGDLVCGDVTFTNGTATFTLKHNESKTIENIPAGFAYLVEESDNGGYAVTVNGSNETTANGMISANAAATAAFNNYKSGGHHPDPDPDPDGGVKITKTVTGNKAPANGVAYEFKVWVRSSSGTAVSETVAYRMEQADGTTNTGTLTIGIDGYTFSLKDRESMTFSSIASGRRVEVKEITTGAFTTTTGGLTDGVCVISPNTTKAVAFTNDYGNTTPGDDPDPGTPTTPTTPTTPPKPTTPDRPLDKVPRTGDNSNTGLWIGLASLSLFGMLATVWGKKRYQSRRGR